MKKFLALTLAAGLIICMAGCDSNSSGTAETKESDSDVIESSEEDVSNNTSPLRKSKTSKDAVKAEDIDWTVEGTVVDGERRVVFNYVNNSPYTIVEIDMKFIQREDLTDEEKAVLNACMEEDSYLEESNIEDMYMEAILTGIVEPGETSNDAELLFDDLEGHYVSDISQYEIMAPDMMGICFLTDNDTLYATYYDFKNDTYGDTSSGEQPARDWPSGQLGSTIPIPDAPAIMIRYQSDDYFSFDAVGMSAEEFSAYADECKDAGFTVDLYESDDYVSAENDVGDDIGLYYNSTQGKLTGTVTLYDDEDE